VLTDPQALSLVTPGAAASVLVLPAEGPDADLEVVRVLLALRSLRSTEAGPPVVAAVRDGRCLPAARLAAGPRGTVLETDLTTARLLVQAAGHPGLGAALRDLLDFAGAEFHVVAGPEPSGLSFRQLALRFEAACPVGILRADGRLLLTPGSGAVMEPGDRLVIVAHDDWTGPPADCRGHVDPTAMAPHTPQPDGPSRTLLLGWNRRAPLVVDLLRRTARPGSALDIVTGSGPVPSPTSSLEDGGRLRVTHHLGDPGDPEALQALEVSGYDSVLVLGPDAGSGTDRPDDRTLLTLLILSSLEEEAGRALPVVAELCDHRSRAVAPLGPAADAIVRGELTALLMAQISQNPDLAAVFEEVFATRGGALALRPAHHYVLPGREASFATVVAAALERGECAIGYRAHDPHGARPYDDVRLCPRKSERRVWGTEDDILVMTAAPAAPAATDDLRPELPSMRREHEVP
jgi:hypothetical protein